MKYYLSFCLTILLVTISNAQINYKTLSKDFQNMSGSWKGSLTYLDYSSGKPYTMPADVDIERIGKTNKFIFSNTYANEPSANSTDTITLSTDGKYIGKEFVKSRRKLPNGDIEIITEELGQDGNDNKPATFRHTYIFGKNLYKNIKDVQFSDQTQWINRHQYTYSKKGSN